jgi:hypothetical protein
MATVRGTVVMDLGSGDLPRARALVEEVRARSPLARRTGTLVLHDDGRLSFTFATGGLEVARVLQAVGIATSVSVTTSLAWGWMFHQALGAGGAIGLVWATAFMILDRRRIRRQVRALGRSLAGLVRSRREQPR